MNTCPSSILSFLEILFPLFKINMDTPPPPPPNCKTHHLHCLSYPQYLPVPQKHLLSLRGCHHHYHFQVCQLFVNASSCFWHRYPLLWMIMLPVATLSSSKKKKQHYFSSHPIFSEIIWQLPFSADISFQWLLIFDLDSISC